MSGNFVDSSVGDVERSKPKSATPAVSFFIKWRKDIYRKQKPNEKIIAGDFNKQCSEQWKLMNDEQKADFVKMAQDDKERFEAEMAEYDPSYGVKPDKKRKRTPKEKDPNAPKRSLTAFFIFSSENREQVKLEHPTLKGPDMSKHLGAIWRELSAEDKNIYNAKADEGKKEYLLRLDEYKKTLEGTESEDHSEAA